MGATPTMPVYPNHRYELNMPAFTRIAWASDHAREVWEPRLHAVRAASLDLEWMSVEAGIRPCCIATVTPAEMLRLAPRWLSHDLTSHLVDVVNLGPEDGSDATAPGRPVGMRLIVGRLADVKRMVRAVEACDNDTIGLMLGYPPCCTEFFRAVWVEGGMIDTTWPMAAASPGERVDEATIRLESAWEANILWRWGGVRPVPSLPCRFDCPGTLSFARALAGVARDNGLGEAMDWTREILSWPIEWSALHGIAEITTPICKISTPTDATGIRHTVQREGTAYPEEGARGLGFPYDSRVAPASTGRPAEVTSE